jgi:type IV pilus assembly protein PilB
VPAEHLGLTGADTQVFEAVGCPRCRQTGYRGRVGIFEVMRVTDEIRSLIVRRAPAHELAELAVAQGMSRLHDDGVDKIIAGETTLAELGRVLG